MLPETVHVQTSLVHESSASVTGKYLRLNSSADSGSFALKVVFETPLPGPSLSCARAEPASESAIAIVLERSFGMVRSGVSSGGGERDMSRGLCLVSHVRVCQDESWA